MPVAPAGFTLLPGTERMGAGQATRVFGVARDGEELVCKVLGPRALAEPWMRERLVAEGRLLGLLGGAATPRLVASGEDAGGPWIVMERIAWPPLESYTGKRDAGWLESAARAAFDALAAVHAAGVVHGDVSPDNVHVSGDGARAALVDFGLALGPTMPPMPAGPFRGTLLYAAPEVARGVPHDGRADLFAMAASLLHVWSGEAPRGQPTDAAMLLAAGEEGIEAWAERAAQGLAPEVARTLVTRCSFDAKDRVA
jgi:serine/threonine protein kinase